MCVCMHVCIQCVYACTNTWRGSAKVVVTDAEVVVAEELLREPLRGRLGVSPHSDHMKD